jgi:hypothetical protein
MKRSIVSFVALPMIWMSWSCGPSLKITSDYDRNTDFSGYKTFAIYNEPESPVFVSQLNHDRILHAVTAEMTGKGFQQTDGDPDLLVNPISIVKNKESAGLVRQYKVGSLIIDVVDAKTKKLLWQGVGNSKIDTDVRDPEQRIRQAINKIMADFPPGNSSKS